MPCASAKRRASAAGNWPGSSSSGRLLTIVRTPAAASVSMSSGSSLPATLSPGASSARGGEEDGMRRLQQGIPAESQPAAAPSSEKNSRRSGGELPGALQEIAGPDPEPLEPAQRHHDAFKVGGGDRGLVQHFDMPPVHDAEPVTQIATLVGEPHVDRAAVVHRALLHEIAVLDHLLDVIGDVRPEIAAAQGQFADRHLGIADVEQHHALHVVDVVDAEPVEFELDDFEEMPVKALDQRDHLKIAVRHMGPRLAKMTRCFNSSSLKLNRKRRLPHKILWVNSINIQLTHLRTMRLPLVAPVIDSAVFV